MLNNMEGICENMASQYIYLIQDSIYGRSMVTGLFLFDDSHLFCVYQVKRDYHKESLCERARANSMDLSTDGTVNMLIKLFVPPGK